MALLPATPLLRRGRGVVEAARQLAVIYEARARYRWDRSPAHPAPPDTVRE
ncbi:hypothetical protein ACIQGO_29945 [Streptomyces shenzhenensis]|uniref:hypothetical protein n=1 Tax=Streptomyces shenzhenensis TaxID=943815 RepID=UPI00380D4610